MVPCVHAFVNQPGYPTYGTAYDYEYGTKCGGTMMYIPICTILNNNIESKTPTESCSWLLRVTFCLRAAPFRGQKTRGSKTLLCEHHQRSHHSRWLPV